MKKITFLLTLFFTINISAQSFIHSPLGDYLVTWGKYIGGYDHEFHGQYITNDGNLTGPNFKLFSTVTPLNKYISVGPNREILIFKVIHLNYPQRKLYVQKFSLEGISNTYKFEDEYYIDEDRTVNPITIRYFPNGKFIVVYMKTGIIYARLHSNDGSPLGEKFKVNQNKQPDYSFPPSNDELPLIELNSEGDFLIAWHDSVVYAQLYSKDGKPKGTNFRVTDKYAGLPDGARCGSISSSKDGNFLILLSEWHWPDNYDYFVKCISKEGIPKGDEVKFIEGYEGPVYCSSDDGANFLVTWDKQGTWNDKGLITEASEVFALRFTNNGNSMGEKFVAANLESARDYHEYSRSIDDEGNLLFVWTEVVSDDSLGIYFQRWSLANGNPLGDPMRVDGIGITNIEPINTNEIANEFKLVQNYPNPFNPNTTIKYSIPKQSNVTLKVYDVLGSEVATLVNKQQPQGNYNVEFDGSELTSGIYFYRLQAGDFVETNKMILLK